MPEILKLKDYMITVFGKAKINYYEITHKKQCYEQDMINVMVKYLDNLFPGYMLDSLIDKKELLVRIIKSNFGDFLRASDREIELILSDLPEEMIYCFEQNMILQKAMQNAQDYASLVIEKENEF